MPSCVVKWCKNNTTLQKKCLGITFHRFPIGNEPWKDDWIRIIRNCRSQEDWIPSKSSVVCSIHFDQNDLYTTSQGLCRVVTYAVPKLLLFEPPVPRNKLIMTKNSSRHQDQNNYCMNRPYKKSNMVLKPKQQVQHK